MTIPMRIALDEAIAIAVAAAAARSLPEEPVVLSRTHGRVLRQDVHATRPMPGFDNSAMDGFAVRAADAVPGARLALIASQFAGESGAPSVGAGQCVRITTGAPVPSGADAILIKEHARVEGDAVEVEVAPAPGQHIRRAGEDVRPGDLLVPAGAVMTPSRVALAASQGLDRPPVSRRPTVAVFTTGDELVEPGLPLQHGQVYDSNRELLMGLLRAEGLEPVAWPRLPDEPDAIANALRHAGHAFDVVITVGGVSAGEKDHLPALMQAHADVLFWKVRMKPGMPVMLATSQSAMDGTRAGGLGEALFLALPGNPVSVLATFLALARPLLDALQGRREARPRLRARLATAWDKRHARLEFLRGRVACSEEGLLTVAPNPADGSHRLRAAADSDVLIVLDEGERHYPAGTPVDVLGY